MRDRLDGFKQALVLHDIPLPPEWVVPCPLSVEDGRQATLQILSLPERPSALFVNNNILMLGALGAVKDLGLRCPEDISLLGFDDHPWASVCAPPFSVSGSPPGRSGTRQPRCYAASSATSRSNHRLFNCPANWSCADLAVHLMRSNAVMVLI